MKKKTIQKSADRSSKTVTGEKATVSRHWMAGVVVSLATLTGCVDASQTSSTQSTGRPTKAVVDGIINGNYFAISNAQFTFFSCPFVDNKLSLATKFKDGPCEGSGFRVKGGNSESTIPVELADGTTVYLVRFFRGFSFSGPDPTPSVLVGYLSGLRRLTLLRGKQTTFELLPQKIVVLGDPLNRDNDPQKIANQILEVYPSLESRLTVGEPVELRCGKEGKRKNLFGREVDAGKVDCTVEAANG